MNFATSIHVQKLHLLDQNLNRIGPEIVAKSYYDALQSINRSNATIVYLNDSNMVQFIAYFLAGIKSNRNLALASRYPRLESFNDLELKPNSTIAPMHRLLTLSDKNNSQSNSDSNSYGNVFEIDLNETTSNVIFETSGSTGTPKLIRKTLQNFIQEIFKHQALGFYASEATVGTVSVAHMYGFLFRFLGPLLSDRPLFCPRFAHLKN